MNFGNILIDCGPGGAKSQRLVVAVAGAVEHRDTLDTNSATSRKRFIADLAGKLDLDPSELQPLDAQIVEAADQADSSAAAAQAEPEEAPRKSQATKLVDLVLESGAELWRNPDGDAHISIIVGGHIEHHRASSKAIKRWLARLFFEQHKASAGGQAVSDALAILEGKALFDGAEYEVYVRVAEHGGNIYLDLADADWRAVEISAGGWRVVDTVPVHFRRPKAMLALPEPARGGTLDELRDFLNVDSDSWALVASWLIAAVRPTGPYPILTLHGRQGAGKSTAAEILRGLIDPNTATIRAEPRDPRDLMIAASNGRVVCYDNLDTVPAWLSNCLCRLSTGGGFSTRTLYENDEETIFDATRPALLTGIEQLGTRGDLLDRSLLVELQKIAPHQRRTEAELLASFDRAKPRLFGALLDAVCLMLRRQPGVRLERLPRMADFAVVAVAAEPATGLAPGAFLRAYQHNQDEAHVAALESSPVAAAVRKLVDATGEWSGSPTKLREVLSGYVDEQAQRQRSWPKNGRSLSGQLKRLAPNLEAVGILVEWDRTPDRHRQKLIVIRPLEQGGNFASDSSFASESGAIAASCREVPESVVASADASGRKASSADATGPPQNGTPDDADATDAPIQPCSKPGAERRVTTL